MGVDSNCHEPEERTYLSTKVNYMRNEIVTNYEWNDLFLLSKKWYQSTGNVVRDVAIAIENNKNRFIHIQCKTDAKRVASVIMNCVMPSIYEKFPTLQTPRMSSNNSSDFYNRISDKMKLYDCDFYTAVIYDAIEICRYEITKDMVTLNKPIYGRGRRRYSGTKRGMTYKEMNRIASNHFERNHYTNLE